MNDPKPNAVILSNPVVYALESLPELIGERQFKDLLMALGYDARFEVKSGEAFAKIVARKARDFQFNYHSQAARAAETLSELASSSNGKQPQHQGPEPCIPAQKAPQ